MTKKQIKTLVIPQSQITVLEPGQQIPGTLLVREPEIIIQEAKRAATALRQVLDSKEKKVIINDKRYLEFDDWQLLGTFYRITAKVISTKEVKDDKGRIIGFVAKAVAIRDGIVISAAEAECLSYERTWKFKAFNQRFMLRSMAQTRACSKTLRNCLAWVVVLAGKGYATTPAEEMYTVKSKLTDTIYKPIRRILHKKPKLKKIVRNFLRECEVKEIKQLTRQEGEELLAVLNKHK